MPSATSALNATPPAPPSNASSTTSNSTKSDKPNSDQSFKHQLLHAKQKINSKTSDGSSAIRANQKKTADDTESRDASSDTDDAAEQADQKVKILLAKTNANTVSQDAEDAEAADADAQAKKAGAKPAAAPVDPQAKTTQPKKAAKPAKNAASAKKSAVQRDPSVNPAAALKDNDQDPADSQGQRNQSEDSNNAPGKPAPTIGSQLGTAKVTARSTTDPDQSAQAGAVTADASDATDDNATQTDPTAAPTDEIAASNAAKVDKAEIGTSPRADNTSNNAAANLTTTASPATHPAAKFASAAATSTPQEKFVEENQPKIVTGIQGQLLPHGGTMQIQLNPEQLGAMNITVEVVDGVVNATFQTTNEDATRLLSHSLSQLKSGLEAAGVSVQKLHVEQSAQKDSKSDKDSDSQQPAQEQQRQAQQDQQRREMVQRMWRKLAGGDPLDMVA